MRGSAATTTGPVGGAEESSARVGGGAVGAAVGIGVLGVRGSTLPFERTVRWRLFSPLRYTTSSSTFWPLATECRNLCTTASSVSVSVACKSTGSTSAEARIARAVVSEVISTSMLGVIFS
ncbi:hypothetical protein W59_28123 [Rhodococcus opacus RKJ300 = JCM 13270]|uniref:Uncharacterized protein n=1 Tax=Rhodococcus opacus RKJ300 = JCM 13270 TaxID=1165867 RepID=I0WFM1_RHOOP|nr:hypothetical protein W59_28123 [Rhodococcus opacus RKJ300 = JCM 13270]